MEFWVTGVIMDDMAGVGRERERTITVVSVVLTLIALAALVTFGTGQVSERTRALFGVESRQRPQVQAEGSGSYAFLHTQRGSRRPVGFSPCREIHYVVNPEGAPEDWADVVADAVAVVSDRTGLEFSYDGETDSRAFADRTGPGGTPRPVIIGWADEEEVGDLAEDVAGIGGPTMVEIGRVRSYVSGSVVLDRDSTDRFADLAEGERLHRALLLHELGHLVGLDHVDDRQELMYPRGVTRVRYGPGDREGLAALGAIPCRA